MREEVRKFHLHSLSIHASTMYDTLIYPHNIITDTVRLYTLLDDKNDEWNGRGYIAIKEIDGQKIRYFIQEQLIGHLPIQVDETVEFKLQNNQREKIIVNMVQSSTPFRINPMKCFESEH
jgi:hypothetical protein